MTVHNDCACLQQSRLSTERTSIKRLAVCIGSSGYINDCCYTLLWNGGLVELLNKSPLLLFCFKADLFARVTMHCPGSANSLISLHCDESPELVDIDNTRDTFDFVTCSCSSLRLHHVNLIA